MLTRAMLTAAPEVDPHGTFVRAPLPREIVRMIAERDARRAAQDRAALERRLLKRLILAIRLQARVDGGPIPAVPRGNDAELLRSIRVINRYIHSLQGQRRGGGHL